MQRAISEDKREVQIAYNRASVSAYALAQTKGCTMVKRNAKPFKPLGMQKRESSGSLFASKARRFVSRATLHIVFGKFLSSQRSVLFSRVHEW